MAELREVQEWFSQVLRSPQGQEEKIRKHVVAGETGLSALERVGIYGRAYYARLVQVMETEFPVLQASLGDELFAHFAMAYIAKYPPSDYTLNRLGEQFPEFLYHSRPKGDDQWSSFIVELAHLERLINEVYHGDGPEGKPEEASSELQAILQEPWTRTMQASFHLHTYYLEMRRAQAKGGDASGVELPVAAPCRLAIYRRAYKVKLLAF